MPDINRILSSPEQYKQSFEKGLTRILQYKTAGSFILACANLFQHPEFLQNNKALLHEVYNHIKDHYQTCHSEERQPEDAPDDVAVMNSLIDIGLENLEDVEYREVNSGEVNYLLNYNQLRSFRPARMSKTENIQLNMPFNPEGFHFAKPFLEKEIFSEGERHGMQLSLLYNKFPFIHYHALLVVDKARHNNQYLNQAYLDYISDLQTETERYIPGFVITYNSLGAGASVNHLHFHVYLEAMPLPIFSPGLAHNGGEQPYPATCQVFNNASDAWQTIEGLHLNNTPYNLILKNNRIYCLPRKTAEIQYKDIDISTFGWSQMAGLINVDNRQLLTEITSTQLTSCLKSVSDNG